MQEKTWKISLTTEHGKYAADLVLSTNCNITQLVFSLKSSLKILI